MELSASRVKELMPGILILNEQEAWPELLCLYVLANNADAGGEPGVVDSIKQFSAVRSGHWSYELFYSYRDRNKACLPAQNSGIIEF